VEFSITCCKIVCSEELRAIRVADRRRQGLLDSVAIGREYQADDGGQVGTTMTWARVVSRRRWQSGCSATRGGATDRGGRAIGGAGGADAGLRLDLDNLLSKPGTIVSAASLTAAPAAQDNAFWLAGEVLPGEAAASLDPPKTAPE